ncbi:carbohydrate ABC transporter substrate-binding protein, CUT1 family [Agromyces sp. CF514]|uniref:sugar ABC transporter substrate-binding protein n=1 Tax=Agromyces sp. CF514 TaxID=1881031 RepID=UPI0008F3E1BB|nr:maltose ABC transporter substrate-binding protein [Agromyces sp. CF514]SFR66897.1 carbohydrate ABC transporter substrate-binding protein, CUT1 family [Agromyces sp. CF514]
MRRSITIIGAVGVVLALAGCAAGSGDTASTPDADQTLTLWVDPNRAVEMKPLVADFKEKTGVTVELVEKAVDKIGPDFVAQVPTGEGPDLIISAHDGLGEWIKNGVVAPIELGDVVDDFVPVAAAAMAYDGQYYGVPLAIENVALVRNNALLKETKATTFDELIAEGRTAGTEFPVLIQQGESSDPYHMYPLQTSFGAPVFEQNADGSYTSELAMGGDEGHAFANYLAKLGQEGVLDIAVDGAIAGQAFGDGKSPYIITGPWGIPGMQEAGIDFTVLPVPSAGGEPAQPFVGVSGIFISSKSKNPVLANEFVVNYMATEEAQDLLYDSSKRSPALIASADKVTDPVIAGFNAAGAEGAPMPAIPEMSAVWGFWGTAEAQIIDGQVDPITGWDTMIANIQDASDKG